MSLISNINSWIRTKVVGWLEGGTSNAYTARANSLLNRREYRLGAQRQFLKPNRDGYNDNIVSNFLGLALDRGISLLFGKPIEFEWGENADDGFIEWIDSIWEANNKPILLHKLAMYGGEDGTVFVKLINDPVSGWRILAQDPIFKDVDTDPDDDDKVIRYITQYKTSIDGEEVARRETILAGNYDDTSHPLTNWLIRNEISSRETGGKGRIVGETIWPFPLPPIIHWQNLPMAGSIWGMPDIPDDVIEVQDKSNFSISNINRILRFFAHPFRC